MFEQTQRHSPAATFLVATCAVAEVSLVVLNVAVPSIRRAMGPSEHTVLGCVALIVGVVAWLFWQGIDTEVTSSAVRVRTGRADWGLRIAAVDLAYCQAVTYDRRRVHSTRSAAGRRLHACVPRGRGNRGVLLTKADGSRILIGSDDPEALCAALRSVGVPGVPGEGVLE